MFKYLLANPALNKYCFIEKIEPSLAVNCFIMVLNIHKKHIGFPLPITLNVSLNRENKAAGLVLYIKQIYF